MRKLMQLLGFYDDKEYDDPEEYYDDPMHISRRNSPYRRDERSPMGSLRMVYFRGVPSETAKFRLRDVLLEGVMIMLDLSELDARTFEEEGQPLVNFMGGVAFAHKGRMEYVKPAVYVLTPHEGMFEEWAEEEGDDVGSFDRQGR